MLIHGNNLNQKRNDNKKYKDATSRQYLGEIYERYASWKAENEKLIGPSKDVTDDDEAVLQERVRLLNDYKDFLDSQHYAEHFDSRSNLHSSVLEEFMFYLFRDLVGSISPNALVGKSHSFKDIFFKAQSFSAMLEQPYALIEKKDHDFAIGSSITSKLITKGSGITETHTWDIPAIAIECKTYLDKTMLQDVSTAAEQIKHKNPNAKYIVVSEWLKLTESVNLRKFKIDQIYVLRKQKNTDREFRYAEEYVKNPIYSDGVEHLFNYVRDFLTEDWEAGVNFGLGRGYLL